QWVLSSAGRAAPLQGVGRRFDPVSTHQDSAYQIKPLRENVGAFLFVYPEDTHSWSRLHAARVAGSCSSSSTSYRDNRRRHTDMANKYFIIHSAACRLKNR